MLQTGLGSSVPSSSARNTQKIAAAAIWLEERVYRTLCAVAIETNNQALSLASASVPCTVLGSPEETAPSSLPGGEDTIASALGAGSALNRYLASITRLSFSLQANIYFQVYQANFFLFIFSILFLTDPVYFFY
jgi:hypothetical protein